MQSAADRRRPAAAQEEDEWEFYPGTGATDDLSKMVINAPLTPLWCDARNALSLGCVLASRVFGTKSSVPCQES